MQTLNFVKLGSLRNIDAFRKLAADLKLNLPCDEKILKAPDSPLAQPIEVQGRKVGNRWAVHPMEGWDATLDGRPTPPLTRRWENFGRSGAKLIWGGEAMAVQAAGRANPHQLQIDAAHLDDLAGLRQKLIDAHRLHHGRTDDLLVGFQLTHSGRFARPKGEPCPRVAYRHPLLDQRVGVTSDKAILSDGEVEELIGCYIQAAGVAADAGADFVDIKHCHGYLLHEFLGAHTRPGPYGGSFENRTRLLREIAKGIRSSRPHLLIGVRFSAFDTVPFYPDPTQSSGKKLGPGIPENYSACLPYRYGFAIDEAHPVNHDLSEAIRFMDLLKSLDIRLVNISGGSPYYSPHLERPAAYPPSDGYGPPEDPLIGVARHIAVTAELKRHCPEMIVAGSGYSYLQEFLPHVAQSVVRQGGADFVGIGRMVLPYPEFPSDVLEKGTIVPRRLCRTLSDCTTAPRKGLISGCFPLDDYYKALPEAEQLKKMKGGR
ncbi:MAG: NADH:flavin oxidoreductase [Verrucomicrobiae bacterium]|nr:NADH:flavin oxidoreductase [Verrucomicrobiae bacterium]